MRSSLRWVSELTDFTDEPTKNFFKALEYNDKAIIFNNLLDDLSKDNINFKIISGFNYKSKDPKETNFSIIKIQTNDNIEKYINNQFYCYKDSLGITNIELN